MAAPDFDGCRRACRKAGEHTYVWGECEHAPEPEPRVSFFRTITAADGHPSIVTESFTVTDLADRIESALRTVSIRLGSNARAALECGETVSLSGGEYGAMALAVALDLASSS